MPIPERSAELPAINIEPVERLNRLTSIGQLEKQLRVRLRMFDDCNDISGLNTVRAINRLVICSLSNSTGHASFRRVNDDIAARDEGILASCSFDRI